MMRAIKFIAFVLTLLLFTLTAIDAYEYELTGECRDCMLLDEWFE